MDNKVTNQMKALLMAYKAQLICLKGVQADIQRRIESIEREVNEVLEIVRKKEAKPEQPAELEGKKMAKPQSASAIPVRDSYERIQVLGNLWVDVKLNTDQIDRFVGCLDIVKNPRNRRKIKEIIRCEIKSIKRRNLYRRKTSPN